jgi:hypothetical protein
MKTQNTFSKKIFAATLALGILPLLAHAQATRSVQLSPVRTNFQMMNGNLVGMDLIKKIREVDANLAVALEIQMVKVEARSGVGGSQLLLRINNQMVDSVVVETNPDQENDIQRSELRNITRSDLNDAMLVVQNYNNIKISRIEVILGPVAEVTVMGRYANDQANRIGGVNDNQDVKPDDSTVATILQKYYTPGVFPANAVSVAVLPAAQIPTTVQPAKPAQAVVKDTAYNKRGVGFKLGDKVKNRWGENGNIVALDVDSGVATVVFERIGQQVRYVNDLYK